MNVAAHLGVYGLFLGLTAAYTWPLVTAPGHLLPPNGDPRLFSWVLITIFRNLTGRPDLLFHGNAFYPFGNTLSFAEPLLIPAVVAGPLHAWTGNPILAYNVTLVVFWALSGWAMYWVAHQVTRCHPAAFVAAVVFTFAPYRMDHYQEFQMEMAFGIPLAIYALVRFLETQRARYAVAVAAVFWIQAASVWYYAIILTFGLVAVAVQVGALRWRGWRPRALVAAALCGLALLAALAPLAAPYFVTREELGLERAMGDAVPRSANLGSYVEARANWLYDAFTVPRAWEASLFLGVSGLGLAAASLGWLRAARSPRSWVDRTLSVATLALLAGVLGTVLLEGGIRVGGVSLRPFTELGVALLAVLLLRQAIQGWGRWRAGSGDRSLAEQDWVSVLLGLAGLAFLLSLGPVVALSAFGRQPIDEGLYAWLWPYLFLFRAIRGPTRIGILVLFAAGLLAALGAKWLLASHRRPWGPALVGLLGVALVMEYARMPLPYRPETSPIRQVDAILRADRADVVVLEWPPNVEFVDVDAMFRSIGHGKRVVNGLSGFVPSALRDLSLLLSEPETPFDAEAQAALQRIYPLRYLVVRLTDHHLAKVWQPTWHRLRRIHPPILRHRGTHGDTDLYEILAMPERGLVLERWVSYGFLVAHPVLEATVRPVAHQPGRAAWVEVAVNDRPVVRAPLQEPHRLRLRLHPPFRRAAPNMIRLTYGYDRIGPTGDRHAIGTTGVRSPVDLVVVSAGQPHGDAASVRINAVEHAGNRRGYNLVALDPAGRLLDRAAFDTFLEPDAAGRLARWIDELPAGTIVAGAAKDDASGRLDGTAHEALRTLGVVGDLRGRFRDSHAFVGVKGAPPGSALEGLGPRRVALAVGEARPEEFLAEDPGGFELTSFSLRARHPLKGD
ncbi:MAG TPA: interleukin-like EMT inducer domain-containing protein [Methylomirabilota bacterium]|nr:interleukin-like EMT inducer domain-containing protein [Methylomirabilota bacterium]